MPIAVRPSPPRQIRVRPGAGASVLRGAPAVAVALAAALLGACAAPGAGRVTSETSMAGDTTVVTSAGAPDTLAADSPSILWRSAAIEQPRVMAASPSGGQLAVGDRVTAHVLTLAGGRLADTLTVGGPGGGPGEFRDARAVGFLGPDTLGVFDYRAARLTLFDGRGRLLGTRPVPGHPLYAAGLRYDPIRWVDGDLLVLMNERGIGADHDTVALGRVELAADTIRILQEWQGGERKWINGGQGLINVRAFPRNVVAAIGTDGRVAVGHGHDYCVTVLEPGRDAPRRFCRDRERTPVGEGVRNPDWSVVADPGRREMYRAFQEAMEIGPLLPSYDRVLWAENGELWVRTLGPEMADVHPFLRAADVPGGPAYRYWDIFGDDGVLRATVRFPIAFDPQVILGGEAYGFLELPTGEVAIGRVGLGDAVAAGGG